MYNTVNRYRDDFNQRKGRRDILLSEKEAKEQAIEQLIEDETVLRQVARLFSLAGEYARQESKITMERLVTNALTMVFQSDLTFIIEMVEHGERSEADFYVSSTYGGTQVVKNDPGEARGGGVVDVISLALRVAMLETTRPPVDGPLVLDEPGKHVSDDYVRNLAEFLNTVSHSFNRQILMVTHNQQLADAGSTAYQIEMKGGESQVIPLYQKTE
ncbi:MAG: hypothetical protein ACM3MK_10475 [Chitinophagales bacterium]